MRRAAPWVLLAAAAVVLLAPTDAGLVERWYSTGAYPSWQSPITRASNAVPFALFDVLLPAVVGVTATIVVAAVRTFRRGMRARAIGTAVLRCATLGAILYLWFLGVWGLNYRRVPLMNRLELTSGPPTAASVTALGHRAVEAMNLLYGPAHATGWSEPWRDRRLRDAYQQTQRSLSDASPAVPGRLKHSVIGPYFRWASVDGMIDPFALEVLGNPDLLPFELPFVTAHEWAHLAGYANESEASFVGFVTCLGADAPSQYSAWLFLYWEVSGAVGAADRKAFAQALAAGPRGDLAAVVERVRRGQLPRLRVLSWAAYDQYLKANRVEEGVRSYDEVLTLLSRVRFTDGWVPVRAGRPRASLER
jgi:hypothetical protein